MAQIGAGVITLNGGNSYPNVIDSGQTFQNGSPLAPDSDTRIDSEIINDLIRSIINIEVILGALPQGLHGSVLARLEAIEARLSVLEGP